MSSEAQPGFAQIVVQSGAPGLPQPFTYRIPVEMTVGVGDCVIVPFGTRELVGYVVGTAADCDPALLDKVKDIAARVDNASAFDSSLWELAQWVMHQTLCDAESAIRLIAPEIASAKMRTRIRLIRDPEDGQALPTEQQRIVDALRACCGRSAAPADLGKGPETARAIAALRKREIVTRDVSVQPPSVRQKTVRLVSLCVDPDVAGAEAVRLDARRAPKQARLLRELAAGAAQSVGARVPEAGKVVDPDMRGAAQTLADKGLVIYREMAVRRDPFGVRSLARSTAPPLTDRQSAAASAIGAAINRREYRSFLLYGVTGSGKTEVYMDAVAGALRTGRGAIVLVPEIGLSAQVMDLLKQRFGDLVAVLHSALSSGEWFDEWQRIRRGEARVVVGARSAIFAPMPDIGLIVVDEEHDGAYKQDSAPRYHARDVAIRRARIAGAAVVLGSATPSLESYHRARTGLHDLLTLPGRVHTRPLPPVQIVDLRCTADDSQQENVPAHLRGIVSDPLRVAIADRLSRREQIILFLNRRGFAQFLLCRDCGLSLRCPNCAVALTYHRDAAMLQCHHCDYRCPAPIQCPKCKGTALRPFGIGTEKVQEAIAALFPLAKSVRMDRDTVTRKGSHGEILRTFKRGEADILIGTQMVAKGLDFANVTLVGVINADTALNMPDFRASERAFQLIMQVSGRAGRGEAEGAVMVQTFNPDHDAVRLASRHDYEGFVEIELANRRELGYPPFASLANVVCSGEHEPQVIEQADAVARVIRETAGILLAKAAQTTDPRAATATVETLGPVACPLERLRGRYRRHILVRSSDRRLLLSLMRRSLAAMNPVQRSAAVVDIDPLTML